MFRIPPVDGRIVFGDTEFTTLDKGRRELWELALIIRDPGQADVEVEWQIRPDLTDASPDSLRIGRYYRRNRIQDRPVGSGLIVVGPGFEELSPDELDTDGRLVHASEIAAAAAQMLDGAFLVASVPSADELALERFFPQYGQVLTTHYRTQDVKTLALGWLHGRREERALHVDPETNASPVRIPGSPWGAKELSEAIGVPTIPAGQAHRALIDARWARAVWDRVHGVDTVHRNDGFRSSLVVGKAG